MKRKWKIIITVAALLIAAIGVYASTVYSKRGVVAVQTGKVVRQDLTSLVTASGEIKPKNYINIGANAMGDITELLVKEGDRVRKGQLLARIENTQPAADVESQKANLSLRRGRCQRRRSRPEGRRRQSGHHAGRHHPK